MEIGLRAGWGVYLPKRQVQSINELPRSKLRGNSFAGVMTKGMTF
jgi:hypothetical protein